MSKKHPRNKHYFSCGYCGYIGLEEELKDSDLHDCGTDECPECEEEGYISCCFESYDMAELNQRASE